MTWLLLKKLEIHFSFWSRLWLYWSWRMQFCWVYRRTLASVSYWRLQVLKCLQICTFYHGNIWICSKLAEQHIAIGRKKGRSCISYQCRLGWGWKSSGLALVASDRSRLYRGHVVRDDLSALRAGAQRAPSTAWCQFAVTPVGNGTVLDAFPHLSGEGC